MRDPEASPRGFFREDGQYYYRTRDGEQLTLTVEEYVPLRVLEDVLNRNLFVNTMDIKRTLKETHAVLVKSTKRPPRRRYRGNGGGRDRR